VTSQLYETEILQQKDLPQAGFLQLHVWNNYLFLNKNRSGGISHNFIITLRRHSNKRLKFQNSELYSQPKVRVRFGICSFVNKTRSYGIPHKFINTL
jgi:hypothetical protein